MLSRNTLSNKEVSMKSFYRMLVLILLMFLFQITALAQQKKSQPAARTFDHGMLIAFNVKSGSVTSARVRGEDPKGASTIHGWVRDSRSGAALPGATVLLKGTSLGASTDLDGRYSIADIPAGSYTVRTSYVGYKSREEKVRIESGSNITLDVRLEAVGLRGKEVVVTAQASGQNAAINQQLASQNIVNVVSAARIQELPDANAAESVGRLPGVYVLRSGGEGYEVAIRGLEPKYNEIEIDGVPMAATSSSNRSVNLSMISSSMLSGIEVFKTVTPDMDAAVLGGVVNFQVPEAQTTPSGAPEVDLSMQGGYKGLTSQYNPYRFTGSIGDRFIGNRLGVLVQGVVERENLTGDNLSVGYGLATRNFGVPNQLLFNSMTLTFNPSNIMRYDASVILDYRLPQGKIDLMNFFSRGDTKTQGLSQSYSPPGNSIVFGTGYSPNRLNVMTNLLDFRYNVLSFLMNVKLSNSYSENINPGSWGMSFLQGSAGVSGISRTLNPQRIAQLIQPSINPENLLWDGFTVNNSFLKQRNLTGSLDFQRPFSISSLLAGTIKFGGEYENTYRWYDYGQGGGSFYSAVDEDARMAVLQAFPWMTQPPYSIATNGTMDIPLTVFETPGYSYGNFLNGDYSMGPAANLGMIGQSIEAVIKYEQAKNAGANPNYSPSVYASGANDYYGNEYRSAGYIMATLNIGPDVTIIPGVRYQGLKTAYKASRYLDAGAPNPYPNPLPHTDTTIDEYHGYWLPDVDVRYKPLPWLDIHAAYTNTITYPDFGQITPIIDVNTSGVGSVTWHNYALKPARAQNYDLAISVYSNSIGLFEVAPFLKQIDNLIFSQGTYITDPSLYLGLPPDTRGYAISTAINNPYRVNLWGTELDWATHFWYLPGPLSGIVLNVNYTHIFSSAKYPYSLQRRGPPPYFTPVVVDTFYTDRLVDQPNDIVNLSVGYDYKGFSGRVSMVNQTNVFTGPNFWPELRSYKARYVRWDFSAKQELPWPGLSVFLDLNDLNNASDTYIDPGNGLPTSQNTYGITADLGIRWNLQ